MVEVFEKPAPIRDLQLDLRHLLDLPHHHRPRTLHVIRIPLRSGCLETGPKELFLRPLHDLLTDIGGLPPIRGSGEDRLDTAAGHLVRQPACFGAEDERGRGVVTGHHVPGPRGGRVGEAELLALRESAHECPKAWVVKAGSDQCPLEIRPECCFAVHPTPAFR